jgi:hypothetical protein
MAATRPSTSASHFPKAAFAFSCGVPADAALPKQPLILIANIFGDHFAGRVRAPVFDLTNFGILNAICTARL